jgi:hypothetical protein
MSRTFIRQETQIRNSDSYDDTLAAGVTLESGSTHLERDLNAVRSQLKRVFKADSAGDWYEDVTIVNGKKRALTQLNTDLDDIEEKKVLFREIKLEDISVPAAAFATGTLTATGNFANGDTVTTGTKTYTFQTTLTNVDGNVLIGATASDSLDNLIAAINLAAGAGTLYAAATTANGFVSAAAGAGDTMDVTALVAGTLANTYATTETSANASWGAATLTGGAGDMVTLSAASSQTPAQTAAVGGGSAEGAVVSTLSGDVGTFSLNEVAGPNAIQPKNLAVVRDSTTGQPIQSGGKDVYALLQAETGTVDGDTFNDTAKQVQLSFVRENSAGNDLEQVPGSDIGGKTINYSYVRRVKFDSIPEYAFLAGAFVDESATAEITLDRAIDNQSGAATQAQNIDWRISDTFTLDFQDPSGVRNLVRIAPNSSNDAVNFDVDTFDVDNVNRADFLNGVRFDSGGTAIDVGDVAGTISSAGLLALLSGGAADLRLNAAGEFDLIDGNKSGSTYAGQLKLSDTSQEWSDYETVFGEVSLLRAIYLASIEAGHTKAYAVVTAAAILADVNVTGAGGSPNIDAQLLDYSGVTFTDDVDIYLNGTLMRNGANAAANHDVYPGDSPANGDLKFEFVLKVNDVITMVRYGS